MNERPWPSVPRQSTTVYQLFTQVQKVRFFSRLLLFPQISSTICGIPFSIWSTKRKDKNSSPYSLHKNKKRTGALPILFSLYLRDTSPFLYDALVYHDCPSHDGRTTFSSLNRHGLKQKKNYLLVILFSLARRKRFELLPFGSVVSPDIIF